MSLRQTLRQRARVAWGIAMICGFFLLETWNVDRHMPSPASPFIWALLGVVAIGSIVLALWFGHRARQTPDDT